MSKSEDQKSRETREFTERTLLSLANDLVTLQTATEATVAKVRAIALAHQINLQDAA